MAKHQTGCSCSSYRVGTNLPPLSFLIPLENATSGGMETLRVLESKILDLNAEDERKSKDIMELDETCTQQRAKIEMLDGSGTQHREMIQEFEMQVQSLTTDNETQATKVTELETTNTAQHEQIQSMEKDAARVSDIIKFLEVRVSCLDKDVHSKENKINDLESLAYRQKERIDMLENENLHLKNTVKYLELQGQRYVSICCCAGIVYGIMCRVALYLTLLVTIPHIYRRRRLLTVLRKRLHPLMPTWPRSRSMWYIGTD